MDFAKFTKVPQFMILYLLFDLFYQQLVLATTTFKIFLYQYLNSLLSMNTLSKIIFHFLKKLLTKIYLWHPLIFIHCSQIYLWVKRLIFVLIWFSIKRRKLIMLKRNFKQLLTLSVKSSCFLFNDVYYKQVDGVTMGSPLGPTLTNLFSVYYEHKWLEKCPLQFRPKYYRRYVDDIFLMFESRDHVKKFYKYMNSRHLNFQFTCEEESNNKISFLDISVTRINNKLTTSLCGKKTFSGVYLNFNSFLPMDYKKGLIHTLLFRAYNICADYVTLHTEIEFLKSIWQRNSFPLLFIDKCIKIFLDKLFIKRNISGTVSKKKEVFICLEFLGKMSLQNKRQLTEIFWTCQKNIKLNVVFRSSNRIRNAFRFKDQIPKYMNSKVIYNRKQSERFSELG